MMNSRVLQLFSITCALGLQACGGSSPPPPPPPPPAASVTVTNVTAVDGINGNTLSAIVTPTNTTVSTVTATASCTGDASYGTQNLTATAVANPGGAGGTFSWTVDTKNVVGLTCSASIVANTAAGKSATGTASFSTEPMLTAYRVNVVIYSGGYPYLATKTGVVAMVNNTSFQTVGFFPVGDCALYETPLASGFTSYRCTAAADSQQHVFVADPATGLYDYHGTFVFDEAKWHSVPWGTDMPFGDVAGPSGGYAEDTDGIYYGPWSTNQQLWFAAKSGASYDFAHATLVAQATGVDVFKAIVNYSH